VDRDLARRSVSAGLVLAGIAIAAFALAFLVAILYIRG
jgi:hypothetical protein